MREPKEKKHIYVGSLDRHLSATKTDPSKTFRSKMKNECLRDHAPVIYPKCKAVPLRGGFQRRHFECDVGHTIHKSHIKFLTPITEEVTSAGMPQEINGKIAKAQAPSVLDDIRRPCYSARGKPDLRFYRRDLEQKKKDLLPDLWTFLGRLHCLLCMGVSADLVVLCKDGETTAHSLVLLAQGEQMENFVRDATQEDMILPLLSLPLGVVESILDALYHGCRVSEGVDLRTLHLHYSMNHFEMTFVALLCDVFEGKSSAWYAPRGTEREGAGGRDKRRWGLPDRDQPENYHKQDMLSELPGEDRRRKPRSGARPKRSFSQRPKEKRPQTQPDNQETEGSRGEGRKDPRNNGDTNPSHLQEISVDAKSGPLKPSQGEPPTSGRDEPCKKKADVKNGSFKCVACRIRYATQEIKLRETSLRERQTEHRGYASSHTDKKHERGVGSDDGEVPGSCTDQGKTLSDRDEATGTTERRNDVETHQDESLNTGKITCKDCPEVMFSWAHYVLHYTLTHTKTNPFSCPTCKPTKYFHFPKELVFHMLDDTVPSHSSLSPFGAKPVTVNNNEPVLEVS